MRYQASEGVLNLLIDSTDIKFLGEGEWKSWKHGAERRRQWRKVRLGIDADTLQIQAMAVTCNKLGDSRMPGPLLDQIDKQITRTVYQRVGETVLPMK